MGCCYLVLVCSVFLEVAGSEGPIIKGCGVALVVAFWRYEVLVTGGAAVTIFTFVLRRTLSSWGAEWRRRAYQVRAR